MMNLTIEKNRPCWAGEPPLPSSPSSTGDFDFSHASPTPKPMGVSNLAVMSGNLFHTVDNLKFKIVRNPTMELPTK